MQRRISQILLPLIYVLSIFLIVPVIGAAAPVAYKALRHFGGDFTLTDHHGQRFSLHDAKGKVVLIYFGFTSCADTCPLTLGDMATALRDLGPLAERVQPLFISVDPQRDTQEVLRQYLPYYHPSLLGLTGTQEEIMAVAEQYRAPVYIRKPDENGFYLVDHSSYVYVVGPEGDLANLIRFGTSSDNITRIVRGLLKTEDLPQS